MGLSRTAFAVRPARSVEVNAVCYGSFAPERPVELERAGLPVDRREQNSVLKRAKACYGDASPIGSERDPVDPFLGRESKPCNFPRPAGIGHIEGNQTGKGNSYLSRSGTGMNRRQRPFRVGRGLSIQAHVRLGSKADIRLRLRGPFRQPT